MTTAALVVVGDEILTGKFPDENGPWLVARLRGMGVDLLRIAVVRDDLEAIADEVARAAARVDHVVTSGGVGPTHDDVTVEGVARAFGLPMAPCEALRALIERQGLPVRAAGRDMTCVPEGAALFDQPGLRFPVLRVRNVWVLPGVPSLFRAKFDAVAGHFSGRPLHACRARTDERETEMADRLAGVAQRHPAVAIGSYPRPGEPGFRVLLTLESPDAAALAAALDDLRSAIRLLPEP